MSRKRQGLGDYYSGSTIISSSGWGFSKLGRSMKKKKLEKLQRLKAEADAFYAEKDARQKGKPGANRT